MEKQYRILAGGGGLYMGQVVSAAEFEAIHPDIQRKMLARDHAVEVKPGESTAERTGDTQARLNDLDRQMQELQAARAALSGEVPISQTVVIPPSIELDPAHQNVLRAVGKEVIQPTSAEPNRGEVVAEDQETEEQATERVQQMEEAARARAQAQAQQVKAGVEPSTGGIPPETPAAPSARRPRS